MKKVILSALALAVTATAAFADPTIENKKTGDQITVVCKAEPCTSIEFKLNGATINSADISTLGEKLFAAQNSLYNSNKSEQFALYRALDESFTGPRQEGGAAGGIGLEWVPPVIIAPVTLLVIDAAVLAPAKGISNAIKKNNFKTAAKEIQTYLESGKTESVGNSKFIRILEVIKKI